MRRLARDRNGGMVRADREMRLGKAVLFEADLTRATLVPIPIKNINRSICHSFH